MLGELVQEDSEIFYIDHDSIMSNISESSIAKEVYRLNDLDGRDMCDEEITGLLYLDTSLNIVLLLIYMLMNLGLSMKVEVLYFIWLHCSTMSASSDTGLIFRLALQ